MTQISPAAKALSAGFAVTLLQMVVAIFLVAPDGPFEYRYQTLLQHDSHWFANIVARGYETIVPPISHKMMEVSNTAFFPAYPAIAWMLHRALGVGVENALLITAQSAANDGTCRPVGSCSARSSFWRILRLSFSSPAIPNLFF